MFAQQTSTINTHQLAAIDIPRDTTHPTFSTSFSHRRGFSAALSDSTTNSDLQGQTQQPAAVHDIAESDINEENPYDPQPKRFMQTEHQKKARAEELEKKMIIWTFEKMKKAHRERQQRLRWKKLKQSAPFERLPTELVLNLMEHTDPDDIHFLAQSSKSTYGIFKAHENACYNGMAAEQFSDYKWLFGESKQRTLEQCTNVYDAIFSSNYLVLDNQGLLRILEAVGDEGLMGWRNLAFLQDMRNWTDDNTDGIERYTGLRVARRTVTCLMSFGFKRPFVIEDMQGQAALQYEDLPWEERFSRFNSQPASVQVEIRGVVRTMILKIANELDLMGQQTTEWICNYYDADDGMVLEEPKRLKKWMAELAVGLILEVVIPHWGLYRHTTIPIPGATPFRLCKHIQCLWQPLVRQIGIRYQSMLEGRTDGEDTVLQEVASGVKFAERIGLDIEWVLGADTLAGRCLGALIIR